METEQIAEEDTHAAATADSGCPANWTSSPAPAGSSRRVNTTSSPRTTPLQKQIGIDMFTGQKSGNARKAYREINSRPLQGGTEQFTRSVDATSNPGKKFSRTVDSTSNSGEKFRRSDVYPTKPRF